MLGPLVVASLMFAASAEPELVVPRYVSADVLAPSPDGKLLAGKSGGTVTVWETASGRQVRTIAVESGIGEELVFSPDGTRVATSSSRAVAIYEVASGRLSSRVEIKGFDSLSSLAFAKDAKTLTAGYLNTVRIFDMAAEQGVLVREESFKPAIVRWAGFADASDEALVLLRDDPAGTHRVVRVPKSGPVVAVEAAFTTKIGGIAVSADGKRVAADDGAIADSKLTVYELATGKEIASTKVRGHSQEIVISPDGGVVVSRTASGSGMDAMTNGLSAWVVGGAVEDVRPLQKDPYLRGPKTVKAPAIGANGTVHAVGIGEILRWKKNAKGAARAFEALPAITGPKTRDVVVLELGAGTIVFSARKKGEALKQFALATGETRDLALKAETDSVQLTRNGKWAAAWSEDLEAVDVFERATGTVVRRFTAAPDPFAQFAVSEDGRRLAAVTTATTRSGAGRGATTRDACTLRIWDVKDGTEMHSAVVGEMRPLGLSISADGSRIAVALVDTVRVWDLSGSSPAELKKLDDREVREIAFGNDANVLATAGRNGKLWDVAAASVLHPLPHADASVKTLSWTADGAKVLTGDGKSMLRVFDAATGAEELAFLAGDPATGIYSAWRSPDGSLFATRSSNGTSLFDGKGAPRATLLFFEDGWVAAGADGALDGTPDALEQLHWRVGNETKPMKAYLARKQKKGLLTGK